LLEDGQFKGPFYQQIGSRHYTSGCNCEWGGWFGLVGEIAVNPQGDKIGVVTGNGVIDVFDFNRCTGKLSNAVQLGRTQARGYIERTGDPPAIQGQAFHYGCSFSANGKAFYASTLDTLFQFYQVGPQRYDKQVLWQDSLHRNSLCQHQRGPNGKIYVSTFGFTFNTVFLRAGGGSIKPRLIPSSRSSRLFRSRISKGRRPVLTTGLLICRGASVPSACPFTRTIGWAS
jgi:hypothetical protein